VGSVSAGLYTLRVDDLRVARGGVVLAVPALEAEMPVIPAGLGRSLHIHRLTARGWTLDLRGMRGARAAASRQVPRAFSFLSSAEAASAPPVGVESFRGVLDLLGLPADFSLDGLELEGDVILPGRDGGTFRCVVSGGGLAAGREGRFVFSFKGGPSSPKSPVASLVGDGMVLASMGGARDFRSVSVRVDVAASGPRLPRTVRLALSAGVVRRDGGEDYSFTLAGEAKPLATLKGAFPSGMRRIAGTWKLDLGDEDLAPFVLGRPLPSFHGVGEGAFDADEWLDETHVRGRLSLAADRLGLVREPLAVLGPVSLTAGFDLTRRGRSLRVDTLEATLSAARPILSVKGMQAFGFDLGTRELKVADAGRDLFQLEAREVPVAWAQPLIRGIRLAGGTVRGRLAAGARAGGMSIRSTGPLALEGLSASRAGRLLVQGVDLSVGLWADYAPGGWQVEAKAAGGALLYADARMGRLAGVGQPVKMAGQVNLDLVRALPRSGLTRGALVCDFAGDLRKMQALEVRLGLSGLKVGETEMPELTTRIRADVDPAGRIAVDAPIVISRDGRQSDLMFAGTVAESPEAIQVAGRLTGGKLHVQDGTILAGVFPAVWDRGAAAQGLSRDTRRAPAPIWSGLLGRVEFSLRSLVLPRIEVTDVSGAVVLGPRSLSIQTLHADLGTSGDARATVECGFDPAASKPYAISAEIAVGNLDPAPLFEACYTGRMPTIEGKFDVSGRILGRGRNPVEAALDSGGELKFSSDGGKLRLVSAAAPRKGSQKRGTSIGSLIGDLASAVAGRRDPGPSASDVAGRLSTIAYDQMSFGLSMDPGRNTVLKDVALISPEIRLSGGGRVAYQPGVPILNQPLEATFHLRARGRTADFFRLAGMLDSHADDLGYYAFNEPLVIGGTLGKPDTSRLQAQLFKDAYRNSGAEDLFDKLLGK
jgi:hypothetical protein